MMHSNRVHFHSAFFMLMNYYFIHFVLISDEAFTVRHLTDTKHTKYITAQIKRRLYPRRDRGRVFFNSSVSWRPKLVFS